jgi:hypothetical protein
MMIGRWNGYQVPMRMLGAHLGAGQSSAAMTPPETRAGHDPTRKPSRALATKKLLEELYTRTDLRGAVLGW